jgi:hypothetical protein
VYSFSTSVTLFIPFFEVSRGAGQLNPYLDSPMVPAQAPLGRRGIPSKNRRQRWPSYFSNFTTTLTIKRASPSARPNLHANRNQSAGTNFSSIPANLETSSPKPFATPDPYAASAL